MVLVVFLLSSFLYCLFRETVDANAGGTDNGGKRIRSWSSRGKNLRENRRIKRPEGGRRPFGRFSLFIVQLAATWMWTRHTYRRPYAYAFPSGRLWFPLESRVMETTNEQEESASGASWSGRADLTVIFSSYSFFPILFVLLSSNAIHRPLHASEARWQHSTSIAALYLVSIKARTQEDSILLLLPRQEPPWRLRTETMDVTGPGEVYRWTK